MDIQNLHLPVGEVVPKLDREPSEDMHRYIPPHGIALRVVGIVVGRRPDFAEAPEQIALLGLAERPQKLQHLNVDQEPARAHRVSSGKPSSRAHCSGVSHFPGVASSIFRASFSA